MKKHSPGCLCCNCEDQPLFSDTFEDLDETYVQTGGPWSLIGGRLVALGYGSYYRSIDLPDLTNLRLRVHGTAYDLWSPPPHATEMGFFIGGVCAVVRSGAGGTYHFKLYLGVDEYGQSPTSVIDLGLDAGHTALAIWIESKWTNDGTYFLKVTGGNHAIYGQAEYAIEMPIDFGETVNIGVVGDGAWDDLWIHRSHKANGRCVTCSGCQASTDLPKSISLSVSGITDDGCDCTQLNGDFTLHYKPFLNYNACSFVVSCGWTTDETGTCGDGFDVCGAGNLWTIKDGKLYSSTARNMMEYTIDGEFNCAPGAVNTWTNSNDVGEAGACAAYPSTLTTTNAGVSMLATKTATTVPAPPAKQPQRPARPCKCGQRKIGPL